MNRKRNGRDQNIHQMKKERNEWKRMTNRRRRKETKGHETRRKEEKRRRGKEQNGQ